MPLIEAQLGGLPGPTHHYGGLGVGNVASLAHAGLASAPRAAAEQCLACMALVAARGRPVFVLPPLARPDLRFVQACGRSPDAAGLADLLREDPGLLHIACSSAAMWTANAATVIPAGDGPDGRCHVVPANLLATAHRALEALPRTVQLRRLFARCPDLVVHDPLPATLALADEGAANHSRLSSADGTRCCHVFVHGRDHDGAATARFPARQTRAAQEAVAALAGLPAERVLHVRQAPAAIDAGAFHNDVVMVGSGHRVLIHEGAWADQEAVLAELQARLPGLRLHQVEADQLGLDEAVACYLFNSLLLDGPTGTVLVAPIECAAPRPRAVLDRLLAEDFVQDVELVDLTQSMQGGGGPACLRLRVPLRPDQLAALPAACRIDATRLPELRARIVADWPERLDLAGLPAMPWSAPLDDLLPGLP